MSNFINTSASTKVGDHMTNQTCHPYKLATAMAKKKSQHNKLLSWNWAINRWKDALSLCFVLRWQTKDVYQLVNTQNL